MRERDRDRERCLWSGGMELLGPQHLLGGWGGTCLHGGFCLWLHCWTGWCGGPGPPEECFPLSSPETTGSGLSLLSPYEVWGLQMDRLGVGAAVLACV